MAKLTKDFPILITFRARESDGKKLAALAELTGRRQGEVLRLLLKQAVVAEQPDIRLAAPLPTASTVVEEAIHTG